MFNVVFYELVSHSKILDLYKKCNAVIDKSHNYFFIIYYWSNFDNTYTHNVIVNNDVRKSSII